jgi:hypothetical protein
MPDSNDDLIRKMAEARSKGGPELPLMVGSNLALLREPILGLLRDAANADIVSRVDEFYVTGGAGCTCVVDETPLFVVHHSGAADERGIGKITVWRASPDGRPKGDPIWDRAYTVEATPERQLDQQWEIRDHITKWIAAKKLPDKR